MTSIIDLKLGDCLELMKTIPDKSVDMVCCDLPFGSTQNDWDIVIPFNKLWIEYNRICKPSAAIVLNAIQPFASHLLISNPAMYRYDLVWEKNIKTGFLNSKKAPLRSHELILVFYKKSPTYNPQMSQGHTPVHSYSKKKKKGKIDGTNYGETKCVSGGGSTERFPTSVIKIPCIGRTSKERLGQPTQKPVALCQYLVATYTNEGDTVLDNCMGVGTTGAACKTLNRNFIGIELNKEYYEKAVLRLS